MSGFMEQSPHAAAAADPQTPVELTEGPQIHVGSTQRLGSTPCTPELSAPFYTSAPPVRRKKVGRNLNPEFEETVQQAVQNNGRRCGVIIASRLVTNRLHSGRGANLFRHHVPDSPGAGKVRQPGR